MKTMLVKTIIKLLMKLKLLPYLNINYKLRVGDKYVKVPLLNGLGVLSLSEPWMSKVLTKLKPAFNGDFVDVGVNLGQTLIKAYTTFDRLNYIGFEPNPTCVYYTRALIKLNKFKNCVLLPIGISNNTEILSLNFFYDDDADSTASMLELFRPQQPINHVINIPVFNHNYISNFLPFSSGAILKIDVEGAEIEVLKGLEPWILINQPIIIIEILPVYSEDNKYRLERQRTLEEMLDQWSYDMFRIEKTPEVSIKKIINIGIHDNLEECDYILSPREKSAQISSYFL